MKFITKLLCIVFLFTVENTFSQEVPASGQILENIVAKIDNQVILKSELEVALIQFAQQQQLRTPGTELKCKVLETLIINKVLVAQAEIDSVVVDEASVQSQLDRRIDMILNTYGTTIEDLEEQYGKSLDDIKNEMRDVIEEQLIIQQMQEKISGKVTITPSEVKKFFNEIPKDSLPYVSEKIEIGQIVKLPIYDKSAKKRSIDTLNVLRTRISKGEDFATLAKKYSEGPSAGQGGSLGWAKKGQFVPEFESTVLSLGPGEISKPFETSFGLHIVKLHERNESQFLCSHILLKPQSSNDQYIKAKELLDSLKIMIEKGDDFEKIAFKNTDDEMTKSSGGLFVNPNTGSSLLSAQLLAEEPSLAYITDQLQVGEVSSPQTYTTQDGNSAYRILYLKRKIPPHVMSMKEDYQEIMQAALQTKKSLALETWFEKSKSEVFINISQEYLSCNILKD